MRITPIEQVLIDELIKEKICHEPQKGVGWVPGYCKSKYPCKCGLDWSDPYTGEFIEGDGFEIPYDCCWYRDGHYQYYIDIFIPINCGWAIEIDDRASHSSKLQIQKDREREKDIIEMINCKFLRFTAKKVKNDIGYCVRRIQEKIISEEDIIKNIDNESMKEINRVKEIFNGKIIGCH